MHVIAHVASFTLRSPNIWHKINTHILQKSILNLILTLSLQDSYKEKLYLKKKNRGVVFFCTLAVWTLLHIFS
jgi:hypothetical protein